MDIKISGVTGQIMREALEQARRGRLWLLDQMDAVLAAPSNERSKFAPQIHTLQIPTDKIRDLIGRAARPSAASLKRRASRSTWTTPAASTWLRAMKKV